MKLSEPLYCAKCHSNRTEQLITVSASLERNKEGKRIIICLDCLKNTVSAESFTKIKAIYEEKKGFCVKHQEQKNTYLKRTGDKLVNVCFSCETDEGRVYDTDALHVGKK